MDSDDMIEESPWLSNNPFSQFSIYLHTSLSFLFFLPWNLLFSCTYSLFVAAVSGDSLAQ